MQAPPQPPCVRSQFIIQTFQKNVALTKCVRQLRTRSAKREARSAKLLCYKLRSCRIPTPEEVEGITDQLKYIFTTQASRGIQYFFFFMISCDSGKKPPLYEILQSCRRLPLKRSLPVSFEESGIDICKINPENGLSVQKTLFGLTVFSYFFPFKREKRSPLRNGREH